MTREVVRNDDIVKSLADASSITRAQAKKAVKALYNYMYDCLKERKSIRIPRIGTFSVVRKKAVKYRHFQTKEVMEQKEIDRLKFSASSVIKDDLKSE